MRLIVTGHREEKLGTYDTHWIRTTITSLVRQCMNKGVTIAYSGMASGVDLWFCKACQIHQLPFVACVPFEEQGELMSEEARDARDFYLRNVAVETRNVKNSWMVEHADMAIVVFDGNKGGTANVFQQLIEKNKPFVWINPVGQKVWECF